MNPSAKKTADNRTSKKPGTKPKKKTSQLKRIKRIEDSDSEEGNNIKDLFLIGFDVLHKRA